MKKYYIIAALLAAIPAFAVIGRFGGSLNTSDPEKVMIRIKNAESSTAMAVGDLVSASVTADDGVSMLLTTTSGQDVTCVVTEAIAAGKFGLCQVFGYHSAVKVNGTTFNISTGGRVAASTYTGRGDGTTVGISIGRALDGSTVSGTIPMWLHLQ